MQKVMEGHGILTGHKCMNPVILIHCLSYALFQKVFRPPQQTTEEIEISWGMGWGLQDRKY